MGAFDDPRQWTDATSARTRKRMAMKRAAQEEANVTARNVLDLEQAVVDLKSRIAVVEHWQDTAQGQNGISVNGNVFRGPRLPIPYEPPPPLNPVNPYRAGETALGSADPSNPTAGPGLASAQTDIGLLGLQPLDISSAQTDGYTLRVITRRRKYNSGSGTYDMQMWARDVTWDIHGRFYKFGSEELVGTATITGSGSAGGGLP